MAKLTPKMAAMRARSTQKEISELEKDKQPGNYFDPLKSARMREYDAMRIRAKKKKGENIGLLDSLGLLLHNLEGKVKY